MVHPEEEELCEQPWGMMGRYCQQRRKSTGGQGKDPAGGGGQLTVTEMVFLQEPGRLRLGGKGHGLRETTARGTGRKQVGSKLQTIPWWTWHEMELRCEKQSPQQNLFPHL